MFRALGCREVGHAARLESGPLKCTELHYDPANHTSLASSSERKKETDSREGGGWVDGWVGRSTLFVSSVKMHYFLAESDLRSIRALGLLCPKRKYITVCQTPKKKKNPPLVIKE